MTFYRDIFSKRNAKRNDRFFKLMTRCTILDCSDLNLTTESHKALFKELEDNKFVQVFKLSRCFLDKNDFTYLSNCIIKNSNVTVLSLANVKISDNGIEEISKALKVNQTIRVLDLNRSGIETIGAKFLFEALKENNTLTELDLAANRFGDDGIEVLAKSLEVNTALKFLSIYDCHITSIGAEDLAKSLKKNRTILDINLRYNKIENAGVRHISECLKVNDSIIALDMTCNCIDNIMTACIDIFQALRVNNTLEEIFFCEEPSYNRTYEWDGAYSEVKKKLKKNRGFKGRFAIRRPLLLARSFQPESVFYKDNMPLDIFKVILELCGLWKQ